MHLALPCLHASALLVLQLGIPSKTMQWKCPLPLQTFQHTAWTPNDPDLEPTGLVFGKYKPHLPTLDMMLLRAAPPNPLPRVESTIGVGSECHCAKRMAHLSFQLQNNPMRKADTQAFVPFNRWKD